MSDSENRSSGEGGGSGGDSVAETPPKRFKTDSSEAEQPWQKRYQELKDMDIDQLNDTEVIREKKEIAQNFLSELNEVGKDINQLTRVVTLIRGQAKEYPVLEMIEIVGDIRAVIVKLEARENVIEIIRGEQELRYEMRRSDLARRVVQRQRRELARRVVQQWMRQRMQRRQEAQRFLIETALREGTYYTPVEYAWGWAWSDVDERHLDALRRRAPPSFRLRYPNNRPDPYEVILANALSNDAVVVSDGNNRSSHTESATRRIIWPTTILGGPPIGQIAHLVPASYHRASMYDDVACCVFGLDWRTTPDNVRQKLIHGSQDRAQATTETTATRRFDYTGLKHFACNKIRLDHQGEFYDNNPCVMIIPVLSLDEAKTWSGQGYSAIVMVGGHGEIFPKDVFRSIQLLDHHVTASTDQIDTARLLLTDTVRGLAYSLVRPRAVDLAGRPPPRRGTGSDRQGLLVEFRKRTGEDRDRVLVPGGIVDPRGPDDQPARVPLITFAAASHDDHDGHLAPDPLLLVVKAAVNWSRRNNQQLLAAASTYYDDGDPPDDLDILGEEQYLEWRQSTYRATSLEELAVGLGQPHGYQAAVAAAATATSNHDDDRRHHL